MAVAASGVMGLLAYAGVFYANARRSVRATSEMNSPIYPSKKAAENVAKEWISLGGVYLVKTSTMVRRSVPLSELEKKKFKAQRDQFIRQKIESQYSECLAQADNNLGRELCSFGPYGGELDVDIEIPKVKVIEEQKIKNVEYQRRKCAHVQELRSLDCVELDIARDSVLEDGDDVESIPVKAQIKFTYE